MIVYSRRRAFPTSPQYTRPVATPTEHATPSRSSARRIARAARTPAACVVPVRQRRQAHRCDRHRPLLVDAQLVQTPLMLIQGTLDGTDDLPCPGEGVGPIEVGGREVDEEHGEPSKFRQPGGLSGVEPVADRGGDERPDDRLLLGAGAVRRQRPGCDRTSPAEPDITPFERLAHRPLADQGPRLVRKDHVSRPRMLLGVAHLDQRRAGQEHFPTLPVAADEQRRDLADPNPHLGTQSDSFGDLVILQGLLDELPAASRPQRRQSQSSPRAGLSRARSTRLRPSSPRRPHGT